MATPSLAVRRHQCAAVEDGAVPAALVVFLLRSFSRPRTEHGSIDGTYCKLMIMIYCVVILYVFLFFLFVCHLDLPERLKFIDIYRYLSINIDIYRYIFFIDIYR